jgi:hypothetical protein
MIFAERLSRTLAASWCALSNLLWPLQRCRGYRCVAELEFRDVQPNVLLADLVERADDTAL